MTSVRVYQSLLASHVGRKGRDIIGQQRHYEIGGPILDRLNLHEKGEGP